MTLDEVIQILKNDIELSKMNALFCHNNEYGIGALQMAVETLEQTRWIPCSERLPETNDDVLVYDGADMYVAWYSRKGMWQGWKSHDNSFERDTPIIAWMPLPDPYRGEEAET